VGQWAKKIKGRMVYFGPWSDPDKALENFLNWKDDLYAGRTLRAGRKEMTVRDLVNRFLTAKQALVDSGEILRTSFVEYHQICGRITATFGLWRAVDDLTAEDFERLRASMAEQWGPVRLANAIQRVRSVFKYGYEAGVLDKPVRFGPAFKKPSAKVLRKERAARGLRMFEADELQAVLKAASPMVKPMILLGVNCGFGNTDIATLPIATLDLQAGWVDFPRPKTGIPRRCPLWAETVKALKEWLAVRPKPKDEAHNGLVFVGARGHSMGQAKQSHWRVATEMANVLKAATVKRGRKKVPVNREGLSFYALRHTFLTVADGARDPAAVMAIMGHAPHVRDMAAVCREQIDDDRLRVVAEHVRKWLFGNAVEPSGPKR
jgi:integrase